MSRVYAADGHLMHDPATGLTHYAPAPLPTGRLRLEQTQVNAWPVIPPSDLDRTMPVSLCWSPIVRCNLHCPQCLDDTTVPELDTGGRYRIAAVLAASGVLGVDISGGEPLLLHDLVTLAQRITGGGRTAVSITTNGWHLSRRADELAAAVDAIRVSLDGPDETSHDRIRGAGSFVHALAGVRAAITAGIPLQIQTVLMAGNHARAQHLVDLADSLGAGGVTFLQMLPIGAGVHLQHQMLTDPAAICVVAGLRVPDGLRIRLRTRVSAGGFTVVRADGRVWRNDQRALRIGGLRPLTAVADLALTARDGSA